MPPKPRTPPPRARPGGGRAGTGGPPAGGGIDRRLVAIAAAGLLVLVAVILGVVLSGSDDGGAGGGGAASARTALEAAGCTLKVVPALKGADHSIVNPDDSSPKWNTVPPTSGPHYAETLIYGSYREPVQQARTLHNLEHGAVAIQYGSKVPEETVTGLQAFYDAHPNGTILAPYPKLGDTIALTAWNVPNPSDPGTGVLASCTRYEESAFAAYLAAFQFKGPERFSPGAMTPGSG